MEEYIVVYDGGMFADIRKYADTFKEAVDFVKYWDDKKSKDSYTIYRRVDHDEIQGISEDCMVS
jgi:hypothetical protein